MHGTRFLEVRKARISFFINSRSGTTNAVRRIMGNKECGNACERNDQANEGLTRKKKNIQELNDKEEFQADEDEPIEGEEDAFLVDNKAATLILVQVSGSWRTRHLRVRASALKQRVDLGKQKVCHVPGRSMLADLNTKSHPQARLTALRRMWSIEKMYQDDTVENPTDSSEGERSKVKIKMIRVKPESKEEDHY